MNPNDPAEEHQELLPELPKTYKELDFNDEAHRLLSCPKCNHLISGEDINIEKTVAKCSHCGHVFGFSHDSKKGGLLAYAIPPVGVETLKLRSELDISLDWSKTASKGGKTFMMLFTFMWNIILLPIVLTIILSGSWGILLFLSLHLLVGLGLLWYTAAMIFNKSSISLDRKTMKVRTTPISVPWHKARDIEISQIRQFYVTKYTASTTNGVPNYAYALYAIMEDGERISLLRGMTRDTQHYIEKELEAYLGITNIKVEGEDR